MAGSTAGGISSGGDTTGDGIMDTRAVIERHLEALLAADLETLISTFADDAVVISPEGPMTTRGEIVDGCRRLLSGLFAPGTYTFTVDSLVTDGEIGLLTWHASCRGTEIPFAADTFIVRDGRISSKTFAVVLRPA